MLTSHEKMQLLVAVLLTMTFCLSSGDNIEQKETELSKKEGETTSLECTFSTSSTYFWIYWYRQYPGRAPKYILLRGSDSYTAEFAKQRFSSNADKSLGKAPLSISNVQLGDSAVYYCALRTALTGGYGWDWSTSDKLTFAKGTTLTVYAKEPKISVLSLLFPSKETELDVCVATGGVQRDQEMTLRTTEVEAKKVKTIDGAMYSLGNANYFAAFDNNITTCDMGGQQDSRRKSEDSTESNKQDAPRPSALPCPEGDDANTHTTHTNDGPKVNFRMLTINSIRVLLAKAVAFDILVTVKAMFF